MAASRPDLSCTAHFVLVGNRDVADVLRRSRPIGAKIERATNVGASKNISQRSELRGRAIGVVILAAASAGRIAWKVVGIVSGFPDSSSARPSPCPRGSRTSTSRQSAADG